MMSAGVRLVGKYLQSDVCLSLCTRVTTVAWSAQYIASCLKAMCGE
jgi:hypothetical protein